MINYNSLFCFQFSKQQLSKFRVNNDLKNIDIDTWNSFIISEFETLHKLKIITFVHILMKIQ